MVVMQNSEKDIYEVKPMNWKWFIVPVVLSFVGALGNGLTNPSTWFLLICGIMTGFALILCFPKLHLDKD